ncbi:phosphatase [Paramagnetospirillum kuznetsovii]|uniref:Phosphatase n=1 Tax=Paramagnetospirillum kuznetsovii TaxID=2053833 RepID=A0A364P2M6_9PROT|nr:HAD-IA family hydrolase [Paramagnetospirillum kuznetsovii]RAU23345.1 phosphatase [Paramagnetospirillum kuznetsovii]
MTLSALIFDVDGTLAETEEAHRHAFLLAFGQSGLDWRWDPTVYRELLKVSGGRERILAYDPDAAPELVAGVHRRKTQIYTDMIASGRIAFRPGVEALINEAREAGVRLAIASTTSRANVEALLGRRRQWFEVIACGEDTVRKKPDPQVYQLVAFRMGLPVEQCIAIEDSTNGVKAAVGAGIPVVVTPSLYTTGDDFTGAAAIYPNLAEVKLNTLRALVP